VQLDQAELAVALLGDDQLALLEIVAIAVAVRLPDGVSVALNWPLSARSISRRTLIGPIEEVEMALKVGRGWVALSPCSGIEERIGSQNPP
jgi:hypothetical protein